MPHISLGRFWSTDGRPTGRVRGKEIWGERGAEGGQRIETEGEGRKGGDTMEREILVD